MLPIVELIMARCKNQ